MKKIMFNDKYGLTQAVFEGRKTMTRRMINPSSSDEEYLDRAFELELCEPFIIERYSKYNIGEIIAIAQNYQVLFDKYGTMNIRELQNIPLNHKGWTNKMFVRADLMPHQIRITDIKVEKLQDISDEDCLKEGISSTNAFEIGYGIDMSYYFKGENEAYYTQREAFAALIDKVSRKGTWNSNPYVFVYDFELVK